MLICPNCDSKRINQFRTPTGPIWCENCGFREERKEEYNSFIPPIHASTKIDNYWDRITEDFHALKQRLHTTKVRCPASYSKAAINHVGPIIQRPYEIK